jgi:LysM repeat protein
MPRGSIKALAFKEQTKMNWPCKWETCASIAAVAVALAVLLASSWRAGAQPPAPEPTQVDRDAEVLGVAALAVDAVPDANAPCPALVNKSKAAWKYWDRADDPGDTWARGEYDDTKWAAGPGPLGYGDPHIKSTVEDGDDSTHKNLVVFFRHTFQVDDPTAVAHLLGALMCDDGAAVYLNGQEVYRRNLPDGALSLTTTASEAISGDQETTYWEFPVDAKLLRKGDNTLAVRVHQANGTSSDLGFDLELRPVTKEIVMQLRRRVRQAAIARAAQVQQAQAQQPASRTYTHLTDGEVNYLGPDGVPHIQRMDAIEQARSYVPSASFVRTMQGDTLAKLAAQHRMDVKKFALLNRTNPERVYTAPDVVCTNWTHHVQQDDTLERLAQLYETTRSVLAELNGLSPTGQLEPGSDILVPGEFSYHYRRNGYSYLRLAHYVETPRQMPFDQTSTKMRREILGKDQNLADIAKKNDVTEAFLRQMNGLDENATPQEGRMLLVEYSVELAEGATLEQLAQVFNAPMDRMLAVNKLENAAAVKPGQRLNIPIGDRFGDDYQQERPAGQPLETKAYEVVLEPDQP